MSRKRDIACRTVTGDGRRLKDSHFLAVPENKIVAEISVIHTV